MVYGTYMARDDFEAAALLRKAHLTCSFTGADDGRGERGNSREEAERADEREREGEESRADERERGRADRQRGRGRRREGRTGALEGEGGQGQGAGDGLHDQAPTAQFS